MKLGSVGMSTSHWYAVVALWFAPGAEEGHGTAQTARTYSTVWCQSRILPTGYKGTLKVVPYSFGLPGVRNSHVHAVSYHTTNAPQNTHMTSRDPPVTGPAQVRATVNSFGRCSHQKIEKTRLFTPHFTRGISLSIAPRRRPDVP